MYIIGKPKKLSELSNSNSNGKFNANTSNKDNTTNLC
jgi:hypothetical protein